MASDEDVTCWLGHLKMVFYNSCWEVEKVAWFGDDVLVIGGRGGRFRGSQLHAFLHTRHALLEPRGKNSKTWKEHRNGSNAKRDKKSTTPVDSRIITDYSTKGALPSLTLEIERDPVCSERYGRR